ncbi:MAG TPA: type II toxin-antitoxin system VapC family toxin [Candidatus Limnocylindrales bacterium]|nr:type II toxin-antitoxin system VapC family toxin [Candidatus Limnocylindrales bacterium]
MIVLDTNVLVYAVGGPHPLAAPCRALVEAIRDRRIEATTAPEVIQEFVHVAVRRRPRSVVVALAGAYADLLAPLQPIEEPHLRRGLRVFLDYPDLDAFDALLAGTVLEEGLDALVSADAHLQVVNGLDVIVPGTSRFDDLLG